MTTLNGEKVFDALRYDRVFNSHTMSWRLTKKYDHDTFPATARSLGYKVEVFVESIGQSLDEYLVNPSYFEEIMSDHGMKLVTKSDFEELFQRQSSQNTVYGDMLKMEPDYQKYSFLNMFMVFEKE
jgi:hypothetical protein